MHLQSNAPWSFNFDFSMTIQDTFPVTRDLNRFPFADVASNALAIMPPDPPRPNRLTTVNVDVQNHIMAFLPTRDLSALMRTCRYFFDACLLPLCARSGTLLCDDRMAQVPSFRQFLRIKAGPSSRVHLVKELWIGVNSAALRTRYHHDTLPAREQWSSAFIDILRHCRNVRRLRIDRWLFDDISFSLLVNTISSSMCYHLEDLTIPSPHNTQGDILCRLSRLHLRRLSFLHHREHTITFPLLSTPVSLERLPRSLTELDIHRCPSIDLPFLMVRKLGVRETMSNTFLAYSTAAFPNVAHLILRRHTNAHPRHGGVSGHQLIDDHRKHNKLQWQSGHRDACWPSLSTVWAGDVCALYHLGLSTQMTAISIPLRRNKEEEAYVAPVLADTSPTALELRVDMDEFDFTTRAPAHDWHAFFGPSTWPVLRLTLLVHTRDVTNKHRTGCILVSILIHAYEALSLAGPSPGLRALSANDLSSMVDIGSQETLDEMLPAFASLTHLLVRFVPNHTRILVGLERWKVPAGKHVRIVHDAIQAHLRALTGARTSLRWVGYKVDGLGLKSWDVSRAGESPGLLNGPMLTETSESAGLAVLKRERMDEFEDVKPLLVVA